MVASHCAIHSPGSVAAFAGGELDGLIVLLGVHLGLLQRLGRRLGGDSKTSHIGHSSGVGKVRLDFNVLDEDSSKS